MALSDRHRYFRNALLAFIFMLVATARGWGAPDQFAPLKSRITELQGKIAGEERQKKLLTTKEALLTKKVTALKKEAGNNPGIISNIRIENLLKELRDNLNQQQETEIRRHLLLQELGKNQSELEEKMDQEISRLIRIAQSMFKDGKEKDADQVYHDALLLMEQRKKFDLVVADNAPTLPSVSELILDGTESAEKLRELLDFAVHDMENLDREIKRLQEMKSRNDDEISLRKNLIRYPALLARDESASPLQLESVHRELIDFEKKGKILESKIGKAREIRKVFGQKIVEFNRLVEKKEE